MTKDRYLVSNIIQLAYLTDYFCPIYNQRLSTQTYVHYIHRPHSHMTHIWQNMHLVKKWSNRKLCICSLGRGKEFISLFLKNPPWFNLNWKALGSTGKWREEKAEKLVELGTATRQRLLLQWVSCGTSKTTLERKSLMSLDFTFSLVCI